MQDTKRIKNPGKQRKRLFNAPAHIRHKLMAAPLSKELIASRGAKTLPVRKGDTVQIKRGDNKGFEGKVSRVDLKAYRIYLEGLTREKVDGTNIFISVHPSKVQIRSLNLDDKWRKNILERKKAVEKPAKAEKPTAKPIKKAEKVPAKIEAAAPEITKEQAPAEEAPVKPVAKKPAVKKVAPAKKGSTKKTEEKEATPKAKAKKASEKTKGEQ
jgi:large subunit ribosomal protein L24